MSEKSKHNLKKEDCIRLLVEKSEELKEKGDFRLPKRSDFDEKEVMSIKAFFGPWPRALEEAGVKEKRSGDRLQKNREKRIRAKRARNRAKREQKAKNGSFSDSADQETPPKGCE